MSSSTSHALLDKKWTYSGMVLEKKLTLKFVLLGTQLFQPLPEYYLGCYRGRYTPARSRRLHLCNGILVVSSAESALSITLDGLSCNFTGTQSHQTCHILINLWLDTQVSGWTLQLLSQLKPNSVPSRCANVGTGAFLTLISVWMMGRLPRAGTGAVARVRALAQYMFLPTIFQII